MERSRAVEVGSTVGGAGWGWGRGRGEQASGPQNEGQGPGREIWNVPSFWLPLHGGGCGREGGRGQREGLELWASGLLMLQMDPGWGAGEESGDRRQRKQEISPVALNPRSGSAQKTALLSCD